VSVGLAVVGLATNRPDNEQVAATVIDSALAMISRQTSA